MFYYAESSDPSPQSDSKSATFPRDAYSRTDKKTKAKWPTASGQIAANTDSGCCGAALMFIQHASITRRTHGGGEGGEVVRWWPDGG